MKKNTLSFSSLKRCVAATALTMVSILGLSLSASAQNSLPAPGSGGNFQPAHAGAGFGLGPGGPVGPVAPSNWVLLGMQGGSIPHHCGDSVGVVQLLVSRQNQSHRLRL